MTKVDGKDAVWLRDIDREKFLIKPFSIVLSEKDKDGLIDYYDFRFTIKIGEEQFSSYLSAWSNDLETIRHSIENLMYSIETNINLKYDDTPTQIMLRSCSILDRTVRDEHGIRYYWKHFVRVIVKPDDFHRDNDVMFGFCDGEQVIKEIYEALLNAGRLSFYHPEEMKEPWEISPKTFYNKIKSPIIERYICTPEKDDSDKARLRQVYVDHVLLICADVMEFLWDENNLPCGDIDKDDIVEISFDDAEYKLHIPGMYKWYNDFCDATDFADSVVKEDFDLDAWHKQGMALAREMRKQLPTSIDLWYDYPFEDKKNRGRRAHLIYNE